MIYYFPTSKDVEDSLSSLGFDPYTKRYYDANGLKYDLEAETEDYSWIVIRGPEGQCITEFRGRFITKTGNEISIVFDTSKWSLEDIEEWMASTFETGLFEYLYHENDMPPYFIEEWHKNVMMEKELSVTHKKLEDLSPKEWEEKKIKEEILRSQRDCNGWIPSIEEITLLSVKEARTLPESILKAKKQYWLKDPGFNVNSISNVYCFGCWIDDGGKSVEESLYVRPVLRISNLNKLNLNIGDTVRIFGLNWVMISPDKVFSEKVIFQEIFRRDFEAPNSTDYEASDVKRSLEEWIKEQKVAFYDRNYSDSVVKDSNKIEKHRLIF